jgi:hypothetical protein
MTEEVKAPPKAKRVRKKFRTVDHKSTIEGCVSDGCSELQSLCEEMTEWRDNLESANMSHMPKFDEVSEVCDVLEQCADEPSIPAPLPAGLVDEVTYSTLQRYARSMSRATRCDIALAGMRAAAEHLQSFLDDHDDDHACWEGCERSDWEQYVEEITNIVDECEGISFPGMY